MMLDKSKGKFASHLSCAPRLEDVWSSGCTAPDILNLGSSNLTADKNQT
jgi:hypothetical protein